MSLDDKKMRETRQEFSPIITEKQVWNQGNVFLSIFLGFVVVVFEVVARFLLDLPKFYLAFLGISLIIIYAIILFFLLEPRLLREIRTTEIRTFEKPVIKEIVKEVPRDVVREVIKEVPRDVIREVEKPVTKTITKTVYVPQPRKKLDIPKYNFLGSSETKVYHTRNCRFGKLIKKKYKVSSNFENHFKNRKYRGCKVCIQKKKKA